MEYNVGDIVVFLGSNTGSEAIVGQTYRIAEWDGCSYCLGNVGETARLMVHWCKDEHLKRHILIELGGE